MNRKTKSNLISTLICTGLFIILLIIAALTQNAEANNTETIYTVDRIENGIIVLISDNDDTINIDNAKIPNAKEGDIIIFNGQQYKINETITIKTRNDIQIRLDFLFNWGTIREKNIELHCHYFYGIFDIMWDAIWNSYTRKSKYDNVK